MVPLFKTLSSPWLLASTMRGALSVAQPPAPYLCLASLSFLPLVRWGGEGRGLGQSHIHPGHLGSSRAEGVWGHRPGRPGQT